MKTLVRGVLFPVVLLGWLTGVLLAGFITGISLGAVWVGTEKPDE